MMMRLFAISGAQAPAQVGEAEIMRQRVQVARWIDEIRTAPIARRRTFNYSRTDDRKIFMIDNHVMDEGRIVNTDQQYHSFHIPPDGLPRDRDQRRSSGRGQLARYVLGAARDRHRAKLVEGDHPIRRSCNRWACFVYHCHAVDHEDKGMMGVIEVVT